MMSLLTGYFPAGPSWAYFTYEPSSGLLHRGLLGLISLTSLLAGYFTGGLLGLTSLMSLLAGYFTGAFLGLLHLRAF